MGHSRKEPTTNVASQDRRTIRDAKRDIRVEDRIPQMDRGKLKKEGDD